MPFHHFQLDLYFVTSVMKYCNKLHSLPATLIMPASTVCSSMFSKYLGGIFMGIFPTLLCSVRPVTLHLLQRHHSSSTLSTQYMFHLACINLTQHPIILSCLAPWDMTTEKHAQLAKMCSGFDA